MLLAHALFVCVVFAFKDEPAAFSSAIQCSLGGGSKLAVSV